jgi:hypothetical protein
MPPDAKTYATWAEFEEFTQQIASIEGFPYPLEWSFAVAEGWDPEEYHALYAAYVASTQIVAQPEDDSLGLKARPLEDLVRYFLEKGGFARDVKELSAPSKWQVDGAGPLNKTAIRKCWGDALSEQCGVQVYMEAKNHVDPATNDEFALHYQRMQDHGCNVGVFASTSGFSIGRGQGIAHNIYHHYLRGIFHLLLVFESFRSVIVERKAPIAVLHEVIIYAMNDAYANDAKLQARYSASACRQATQKASFELLREQSP